MVTHDVDEAVLLSDRIVMMTNGPAATIGEILEVKLPRPRQRLTLAHDPAYINYRAAVLEFLYEKQAHVERKPHNPFLHRRRALSNCDFCPPADPGGHFFS
jgi:nitrate/nitrite transport system ATP-binding protein